MLDFATLKTAVEKQMDWMLDVGPLFRVDLEKDLAWGTYINSFPEGTNPIYRTRTEYDCQCCKQFIRAAGGIVAVLDFQLVSVWDINIGGPFQVVADALAALVRTRPIKDILLHPEAHLGTDCSRQMTDSKDIITWNHFHYKLPPRYVKNGADIGRARADAKSGKDVFKRGLDEITVAAAETVIELIEQGSLYRGEEHKGAVEVFLGCKTGYVTVLDCFKDNYCWNHSVELGPVCRIRNTAIGDLLVNISEDMALDQAVGKFEAMVAPTNYKRPSALITKGMIAKAQATVEDLGLTDSLQRRYAVMDDITINNVLYADRAVKKALDVFDALASEVPDNLSKLGKVEEVSIEFFMQNIMPCAESIEILFENKHTNNLMSLIAPMDVEAKHLFKWDNNFSWAYNGEVADSIKERVKKAGGRVDAVLRCSLAWFNYDDLDIHVREPTGTHIYYSSPQSRTSCGFLDVDMNVRAGGSRSAVENIAWPDATRMQEGLYELFINQYAQRESVDVGFDVEIEFNGTIHTFHYDKKVVGNVPVANFEYTHENGLKIRESLPSTQASKEVWGIASQKFHKVSMIMNSPNHWDDKVTGNKHLFFMLEGCKHANKARGFFNEFLRADLQEHRKVFEVLGSKMKTEASDVQLSGLGFSSTQRSQVVCKVTGSFTRIIKINF